MQCRTSFALIATRVSRENSSLSPNSVASCMASLSPTDLHGNIIVLNIGIRNGWSLDKNDERHLFVPVSA